MLHIEIHLNHESLFTIMNFISKILITNGLDTKILCAIPPTTKVVGLLASFL